MQIQKGKLNRFSVVICNILCKSRYQLFIQDSEVQKQYIKEVKSADFAMQFTDGIYVTNVIIFVVFLRVNTHTFMQLIIQIGGR